MRLAVKTLANTFDEVVNKSVILLKLNLLEPSFWILAANFNVFSEHLSMATSEHLVRNFLLFLLFDYATVKNIAICKSKYCVQTFNERKSWPMFFHRAQQK